MKRSITILLVTLFFSHFSYGQTVEGYSYKKYPAKGIYKGINAKIDFSSNPDAKFYRTKIREGYKEGKIDFAGFYVTTWWGCGTGCSSGAMVDVRDGKVYDLPNNEDNSNNYCESVDWGFQKNSRLYVTSACEYNVEGAKPFYTVFIWTK